MAILSSLAATISSICLEHSKPSLFAQINQGCNLACACAPRNYQLQGDAHVLYFSKILRLVACACCALDLVVKINMESKPLLQEDGIINGQSPLAALPVIPGR